MWKKKSKQEKQLQQQNYESTWEQDCSNINDNQEQFDFVQQLDKIDKKSTKKRTKNKEYYVKGADLKAEIRKYQQSKKLDAKNRNIPYEQASGIISNELGQMIIKICTRFSMHPRFYGYTFRDEFVADAVARCITHGVDKINLDLPNCNPFAYFTQISYNCFRQKIKSQKKYSQTKRKLREQVYTDFQNQEGLQQTKDNQEEE